MIRVALIVLAVLAGAVAAMYGAGMMLPVAHVASGTRPLPSPPREVYALISSIEDYPRWWSDVSRIDVLARDEAGRPTFRQHAADGPIVMQVIEQQPPTRFVTRIADPDQPFGGTWTFELAADGAGTRVTITERGEIRNPIFRALARFVFGYASTMETWLTELEVTSTTAA